MSYGCRHRCEQPKRGALTFYMHHRA